MAEPDGRAGSGGRGPRPGIRPVTERTHVTTAELFFDLVFVVAFLQVTTRMSDEASPLSVLQGILLLTVLWWSWSLFAWLGNRASANYGLSRLVLLTATPIMFVLSVSIPEAFTDRPGGVYMPFVFVAGFVLVRAIYLALRIYASPGLRRRDLAALTVPMLVAVGLLTAAAALPLTGLDTGRVGIGQVTLWAVAVVVDYAFGMALPIGDRRIFSVRHWTERHNLIVIVAIGEVLVAIGLAGAHLPGTLGLLIASALAVVVAGALGWIYFDLSALAGESALYAADPARRAGLGRDGYSYLHLPMITGVILLALGLKHVPSLVGDEAAYRRGDPLDDLGRYGMYGGVALFLLAHAAFQWRLSPRIGTIIWPRLTAAAVLLATIPVTTRISALRALMWLAVVCLVTAVTEFIVSRPQRRLLRSTLLEEAEAARPPADDADQTGSAPS
ncbi:low temperature requirement protein A [Micromonospora cremea]|uniref:Low temperature requirement protein LtrA n=1 Tax=Micromonospora cremea TaxID=709881 RepID=A0A1N6BDF5_9ACTN|nr:low temperature requirement protein A [Micromonospora cremea]SIN44252.1 Low temperature requirement protein LtrA [Micromonospora cremea]